MYEVTGSAPALAGGVKAIWAATLAGDAVPIVGAPGTVAAVNEFDRLMMSEIALASWNWSSFGLLVVK